MPFDHLLKRRQTSVRESCLSLWYPFLIVRYICVRVESVRHFPTLPKRLDAAVLPNPCSFTVG
jgi:hypothetical protein